LKVLGISNDCFSKLAKISVPEFHGFSLAAIAFCQCLTLAITWPQ
jgi:hypothetical protein